MHRKIVFVQGSPRKLGNTRAVTAVAMASARDHGAEVVEIDATKLSFMTPGCAGCQQCQRSEAFLCAFKDEVAKSVAALPEYDVIVLATPLYWWSYSAQLKIFVDRMYSLSKISASGSHKSLLSGKTLAILATAGGPMEDNLEILEQQWKRPATLLGCPFISCLFPNTPPGALIEDPAAVEKARAFGQSLALA
jgi:multimeric flavodoxin WrbA